MERAGGAQTATSAITPAAAFGVSALLPETHKLSRRIDCIGQIRQKVVDSPRPAGMTKGQVPEHRD